MSDFDGAILAEQALAASRSDDCQVIVERSGTANLRWARNSLTTNGLAHDTTLTVIAFHHRADSIAVTSLSGSVSDVDGARALVAAADAAAADAPLAEDAAAFPDPWCHADFATPAPALEPDRLGGSAQASGDLMRWAEQESVETFGYAEAQESTAWFASSTGARLRHAQPSDRLEITAKSHGRSRSTWVGVPAVDLDEGQWHDIRSRIARALERQGTVLPCAPGRHATVLPPSAVADLSVELYWSLLARDAAEGRTALHAEGSPTGTRVGTRVVGESLRMSSDPADPVAPCRPFALTGASSRGSSVFDNGRPLAATDWVEQGVLRDLITTTAESERLGLRPAPVVDTLRTDVAGASAASLDELVRGIDDGLLLTCVWYVRTVDPRTMLLTGLTRDGVYAIRGGEIAGAVTNFRFNDSPLALFDRVTAATASERTLAREMADYANRTVMPALAVAEMNMTSVSDAR